MSERAEGVESFPITADPQNYVRTEATEEALEALQRRVREGRAPVAVVGPPGVGKTLLLRVLEGRLGARFRVVYVPFGALPPDELCSWILEVLGASVGRDPERDLVAASLRLEGTGSALVLILDDAGSMPVETARRLSALVARAERAIRLVVALAEGSLSDQVISSFQPAPSRVQLQALANADETARYLRAHLVRSNAPQEVRARFDPESIRHLHRGSGGVPRVLSGLASELARGTLSVLLRHEAGARDELFGFDPDPFGVTSDPAAYVPRPATEELLEWVEGALREGMHAIGITGPPGLGKTMLLRVLERRLRGGFRAIRISYTVLFPDEFCRWVLVLLGEAAAEDPGAALGNLARRLASSQTPLVLMLDDAGSIPIPTVRYLVELAAETNGAMRLVLAALEDVRTPSILGRLGPNAVTIRFTSRMSGDETAEYIYARLAHARAPTALVEQFDPETVNRLYAESEGIPRELHKLASEIFHEGESAIATLAAPPPVPKARVAPEPEAPPAPLGPPGVEAEETERQPLAARIPIGGRLAVFALLAVTILLVAIPLLRGGFPWLTATPVADSIVEPPVPVPLPETSLPPALDESLEPIAIEPAPFPMEELPEIAVEPSPPPVEEPPEIAVVPEPETPAREPEPAPPPPAVEREAEIAVEPSPPPVEEPPAIAVVPEPEAPARESEPAPPPPAVEPEAEIAVEPSPPPVEEPPEMTVVPEPVPPAREPEPAPPPPAVEREAEIAVEPSPLPVEEPPEIAVVPEPEAPAREPEPAPPPPAVEPEAEIAVEPSPLPVEEPPEMTVVPEPEAPVPEPEPAPPPPAVEPISVSINATPWATIEIDGTQVGITPMAGVLLAPGDHQFRVGMPDGTVLEQLIRIAPDNRHIAFSQ